MGLFSRERGAGGAAALLETWRGELNAELWTSDESGDAYADRAMELEGALAQMSLAQRIKDPVPPKQRAHLKQMLRIVVPGDLSLIDDAATSAFFLARAESWNELDRHEVEQLILACCADAGRTSPTLNQPRYRAGTAITSILDLYPDRTGKLTEFLPLYDYIVELPSHQRLSALGQRRCELDRGAFQVPPDSAAQFRLFHARAWNTGIIVWLFNEHALLS